MKDLLIAGSERYQEFIKAKTEKYPETLGPDSLIRQLLRKRELIVFLFLLIIIIYFRHRGHRDHRVRIKKKILDADERR